VAHDAASSHTSTAVRAGAVKTRLRVVNCAEIAELGWTFLQVPLADLPLDWHHFSATPKTWLERHLRRLNLARWRATWSAARCAKQDPGAVIISHLPKTTLWLAIFCRLLSVKAGHIAFAFNFTDLPLGINRVLMRWAFRKVNRFVVFSNAERARYAEYFGIDPARIDFLKWEMDTPPSSEPALVTGKYVCAVGSEGRDYDTLVEAVRHAPQIRTVIVTRAYNAPRGPLPPNVALHTGLRGPDFWNVVKHAHAVVLPLRDEHTNCGHISLVGALQFGRPIVASESGGVDDYLKDDVNALVVTPGDAPALHLAIERMWNDPVLHARLRHTIVAAQNVGRCDSAWTDYFRAHLTQALAEPALHDRHTA
jgi:glycosyltransferase involved in cell wall biosynthesis